MPDPIEQVESVATRIRRHVLSIAQPTPPDTSDTSDTSDPADAAEPSTADYVFPRVLHSPDRQHLIYNPTRPTRCHAHG